MNVKRSKIAAKRNDFPLCSPFEALATFVCKHNCMRKRHYLLMCVFYISITSKSIAQDLRNWAGIKGGISVPNLTARGAGDNPLNTGYRSRLGPDVVIFWEQAITNSFSIMPGIEYVSEGGKRNGFQAFPFPTEYSAVYTQLFPSTPVPAYLYADFKNEIKLDYLMLSVLAKFNWHLGESSPCILYAEVGPFGAYMLSAKDITSGNSVIYADEQKQLPLITIPISFDNKMDIKDNAHKGNFGIAGDVGFAYNFTNSRIFIEAGGNYGLLNIQKDAANGKNQIGAVVARLGYAISIGAR